MLLGACAKAPVEGLNDDDKLYLESWIQVHHPEAQRTALGAYILEDKPGTGAAAGTPEANPYVRVHCTASYLSGSVQKTTEEQLSKQLGTYKANNYYGSGTVPTTASWPASRRPWRPCAWAAPGRW